MYYYSHYQKLVNSLIYYYYKLYKKKYCLINPINFFEVNVILMIKLEKYTNFTNM